MKPNKSAVAAFEKMIAGYFWHDPSDKEMVKMYAGDRKNFDKVLKLYKSGEWKKAYKIASSMDTAPREYIPDMVWDDIECA